MIAVPHEASAFLGVVGGLLVLLVVLYLYLNRKLCFTSASTCCDNPPSKDPAHRDLGIAFSYEEVDSSTDSEDEVLQRFQQSNSFYNGIRKLGDEQLAVESPCFGKSDDSSAGDPMSIAEQGPTSMSDPGASLPLLSEGTQQQFDNSAYDDELLSESACGESLHDQDTLEKLLEPSPSPSRGCGQLEVAFSYDPTGHKVTFHIIRARDLPLRDRGGASHVQVRLQLLPLKKQKHKTKIRDSNKLYFNEHFVFTRINAEDLGGMGVRIRLYGCERMRREQFIGECVAGFTTLMMAQNSPIWLTLDPRVQLAPALAISDGDLTSLARSDSTGSTQSMSHGGLPELLLGLAYNGTTGRLAVEVLKGSHFHNQMVMAKAPDTYVKLALVSSNGQEIARSKTSVRRGQPNPLFKETFVFQVALFQLPDVTLMVSVYNKRGIKRKEMIGWFSLGLNSSGEEELAHWNDMRENKGEQVCHWHVLLET